MLRGIGLAPMLRRFRHALAEKNRLEQIVGNMAISVTRDICVRKNVLKTPAAKIFLFGLVNFWNGGPCVVSIHQKVEASK